MIKEIPDALLEAFKDHRKVLIISILFLFLSLSIQSLIWSSGSYNSLDMYANEYEAKTLIDNGFLWFLKISIGDTVNPHMPVAIYTLASLYIVTGNWLASYIILLTANAFLVSFFIYKLGFVLTKDKVLASYTLLFFVTMTGFGGIHSFLFPLSDTLGITFFVITLYALVREKPKYLLAGIGSFLTFFSHFYSGMALFSILIILLLFDLLNKRGMKDIFKRYSLPGLSSVLGLSYYTYIYIQMKSVGSNYVLGFTTEAINSAMKNFNILEFPSLFGFFHLMFALIGIFVFTNKFNSIKGFLCSGHLAAILFWTILIIIPTQAPSFFLSLATYRFLSYVFIPIALFASFGLSKFLEIPKSYISKGIFVLSLIGIVFALPLAHNAYAMDPVVDAEERLVIECITENVPLEESVFVPWYPIIYFTDVTNRPVEFNNPVKYYEISDFLDSGRISEAIAEIRNMDIKYAYIVKRDVASTIKDMRRIKTICSSENKYLFEL